ncbi:MAG TPA: sigma-70 family RNA polymerase sigma factor [Candidatus Limnocylindria bacterium]|jgi:RNA polymerase sigma factor (sigma-70 family)|nr:sigma-70 family RNA polymerase sigma factor [Candidatus Limnocylindria bacterium]
MNDDLTLLHRYAKDGDEAAFADLVQRHVNLVWGAAQRITGDADQARDIAQIVFCDLARKAKTLPAATVLAGWLHRSASLAALKLLRTNIRRQERETLAMLDPTSDSEPTHRAAQALMPYVDEALASLPEGDRNAVVLRFFGGQNFAQIGATLGATDDAAQKRVSRAVEKLRAHFQHRGINVSQGVIAAGLGIASTHAAPPGAALFLTATAVGSAASAPLITALVAMKTKLILIAAIAATATLALWEHHQIASLQQANARLIQSQSSSDPDPSTASTTGSTTQTATDAPLELARLRAEVRELRATVKKQSAALAIQTQPHPVNSSVLPPEEFPDTPEEAVSGRVINTLKNLGLAARVYATTHAGKLPATFEELGRDGQHSDGSSLEDKFEFLPQPRPLFDTDVDLIIFREKTPRLRANGTYERTYTHVDGAVQRRSSPTPDFSEYEKAGTATDAVVPNAAGRP